MTYIGIDPGAKGGIATIELQQDGSRIVHVYPYSDDRLKKVCRSLVVTSALCVIEKVGAMPKQGVASTFHFGQSFGYILGVLEAFEIPYQLVTPQRWKRHFSLDKDKKKSVQTAKCLFPNLSLLPSPQCRVESDGMAEALLIALYGARTDRGGIEE